MHHLSDFFDYIRIGQCRDIPGGSPIRDGSEDAAHELAGARLWHIRDDVDVLWPGNLANDRFDRLVDVVDDLLARLGSRREGDIDFRNAAFDFVHDGHHRRFCHLRNRQAGGLNFLGAQAVAGYVDDVIHAAQNAEVSVDGKHRSIGRKIWPILPFLAVGVLAVFSVVLSDEAIAVAPDGLHNAGPGIANADVSRFA